MGVVCTLIGWYLSGTVQITVKNEFTRSINDIQIKTNTNEFMLKPVEPGSSMSHRFILVSETVLAVSIQSLSQNIDVGYIIKPAKIFMAIDKSGKVKINQK